MNTTWILIFIGIVVAISIVGYLLQSFIKVIFVLAIIYLLFHLGFIWGVDDLNEKLHLDSFLKPEVNQQIQQTYSEFTQKREEIGIIETDLVRKIINDTIASALTTASNEISNVNKEQLIQDLSTKLQNFDTTTIVTVLNDLSAELAKYNVTPEEVQSAITTTQP